MQKIEEQFLQELVDGTDLLFVDQWHRVREEWEPGLVHGLGSAVDECMAKLRTALAEHQTAPSEQRDPAALRTRLSSDFAPIMAKRCEVIKELLAEMVTEVARETGEFLTINGLAGDPPSLETMHPDPAGIAMRLGGAQAIDHYVTKAFVGYTQMMFAAIDAAAVSESAAKGLAQRLEAIGSAWKSRLEVIARTTIHNAYNRTKLAITHALPHA